MLKSVIVCGAVLFLAAGPAPARDYYVAPDGDDANPGTLEKPLKDPVVAARKLMPGDTLCFRKGEYRCRTNGIVGLAPNRDGRKGKPITFTNYNNEHVVIDVAASDWGVTNNGFSYIVFDGFEITGGTRHYGMKISAHYGRAKRGTGHHVTIRNCEVHHSQGENIFCAATPHLVIENNHLHHSRRSHGLYLAAGCHYPVIRNNTSEHNRGNSGTQLNGDAKPEGIKNAIVERNILHGNAQGFSLMNLKDAVFRNNVLWDNGYDGPRGSGYREVILWSKRTETDALCRDNLFENNTFVNLVPPGHKMGNIMQIQNRTRNIVFRNNIFVIRGKGLFTFRLSVEPKGFEFENNCLFLADRGRQVEQGGTLADFCKKHGLKYTGNVLKDPMFIDVAKGDLRLKDTSPCVDAGAKTQGTAKIAGKAIDIGAYERGADVQIGCKLPWKKEPAKK